MFEKAKAWVKDHKYECFLIGGTAALGAVATYCGYKLGKEVGFANGEKDGFANGSGEALVSVALGECCGCNYMDKTYKFTAEETTMESMLTDPEVVYRDDLLYKANIRT